MKENNQLSVAFVDIDGTLLIESQENGHILNPAIKPLLANFDIVCLFTARCKATTYFTFYRNNGFSTAEKPETFVPTHNRTIAYIQDQLTLAGIKVLLVSTTMDHFFGVNPGEYYHTELSSYERIISDMCESANHNSANHKKEIFDPQRLEYLSNGIQQEENYEKEKEKQLPKGKVEQYDHLCEYLQHEYSDKTFSIFIFDDSIHNLEELALHIQKNSCPPTSVIEATNEKILPDYKDDITIKLKMALRKDILLLRNKFLAHCIETINTIAPNLKEELKDCLAQDCVFGKQETKEDFYESYDRMIKSQNQLAGEFLSPEHFEQFNDLTGKFNDAMRHEINNLFGEKKIPLLSNFNDLFSQLIHDYAKLLIEVKQTQKNKNDYGKITPGVTLAQSEN